ncbi:Reverse transcriptase [Phytophthora palmivora]|uniref:Reverse transcriptase n=1 Tax=Phytophthora palmivora TaxID=4796 RepID=A0A2P4XUC4_9STRA|nr:Reverse transcriptase [Phytophthora palmivora]
MCVEGFLALGVASDATRAIECPSDIQSLGHTTVHLKHLLRAFEVMRANKLYANIEKRVFAAEEISVLGCFVSRVGVRADSWKVNAIAAWPTTRSLKNLGTSAVAPRPSRHPSLINRPLSDLLKKDADWVSEQQCNDAFDSIKASLQHAPVLALLDETKSFSVVCDASDYAKDDKGRERVISFQSRQLKAAERNYPVFDKELLAMEDALVKFRVHLLGPRPFVIFTDHASLRTATNPPHLSQRMARWLSFFAEYNFRIRIAYKEDRTYVALVQLLSYGKDAKVDRLTPRRRAQLHRYELADGLLRYRVDPGEPPRVVVPNDENLK